MSVKDAKAQKSENKTDPTNVDQINFFIQLFFPFNIIRVFRFFFFASKIISSFVELK